MRKKLSACVPVAVALASLVVGITCGSPSADAADRYWDTNSTTSWGDGGGNWQNGSGSRTSTSASGTAATTTWSNGNTALSMQFGFGTTAGGNNTNGGTVTLGSSGGSTTNVGAIILNASGNTAYTFQNGTTTGSSTLSISGTGADMPSATGYGLLVNANTVGNTIFQNNAGGGTFTITLVANQTWQNNNTTLANALTVNVPILGAALTLDGQGTTTFGGTNGFSSLTLSAGTLRITNGSALGAGSVSVSSTATLNVLAAVTKNISNSGTVSIGAGGNLSASSLGGALSLGGVSGTTATFTSTLGSGTLSLGSLTASGNSNVSLAAGTLINASGVLSFSGASNLVTLTGAAAAPGSYTLVQGSSLSGTSTLSLTGGAVGNASIAMGSSALVGRNTYAFGSSGTSLLLNVTGTIYNLVWDNTVSSGTWNDTSAVWLQSGTGSPITFVNNDNTTFGSAATVAVPSAVTTGSMVISNATGAVGLSGAGAVAASSLAKSGAGSATLGTPTTISNGLTVSAGSLDVTGTTTVTAGGVTVSGGSLVSSGPTNISAGGLNVSSGSVALNAAGTIAGGLNLTGGAVTISAAQALTGTVSLSGGAALTLESGTLGSSALVLNGGTLTTGAAVTSLSNAVTVNSGGGTITTANALALNGAITGAGNALTKSGVGTLTINGGLGTTGNGLVFNVASGTAVMAGSNNKVLVGGTITGNVTLTAGSLLLGGNVSGSGTVFAGNGTTIRSDLNAGGGTKTLSTPVSFDGAVTVQSQASRPLVLSGSLAGSGTVSTAGSAKVSFTGTASSFSGSLVVSHTAASGYTELSTQVLGSATSVVVTPNTARTAEALSFNNTAVGEFGGVISGGGVVSIESGSKPTFSGANTYSGGTLLAVDVGIKNGSALGSGPITATGANARVLWEGAATSATLTNALNTGAATSSVLAFAPGAGKTILLTGSVSGVGQLKVSGGGDLDISGLAANSSTGGIEIGTGRIITNLTNLSSGTINFGTVSNSHLVATTSGTITNPFTIGNNFTANFDTNGQAVSVTSAINDKTVGQSGRLQKLGAGTLTLSGSNAYTGVTTVAAGVLALGNANALAGGGLVTFTGGTLQFSPSNTVDYGARIENSTSAIALDTNGQSFTVAGVIDATNNAGLTKLGAGTLTLSAANAYTGATTVSAGRLAVNGSLDAGSAVTVLAGATLGGSGTIGGATTILGTLSPGNSPGVLTIASVLLGGSSTSLFEIDGTVRGTGYDGVTITQSGGLTYGGALSLVFSGTFANDTTFDLFNFSGTPVGSFSSVTASGPYGSLTFTNDGFGVWTSGSTNVAGQTMTFTQSTGDLVIVPEPTALVLVALGAGGLWLARRRRSK